MDQDGMSKKRVLLVDDDKELLGVLNDRFVLEGFDVRMVDDGEKALDEARDFHPDIVLLDVMMPGVSGFDALDILKHTPETLGARVIMLTALSQEKDRELAKASGADEYLVKSQVPIEDIVKIAQRVLEK